MKTRREASHPMTTATHYKAEAERYFELVTTNDYRHDPHRVQRQDLELALLCAALALLERLEEQVTG